MFDHCIPPLTSRPPCRPYIARPILAVGAAVLAGPAATASAAPSQEDVFRSIQHNVGGGGGGPPGGGDIDPMTFLLVLVGLIVLVALISLANRQKGKPAAPKVRNHQGKLLREVLKTVPIKAKELKQLKVMADHADAGGPAVSPLTLLLCPSVMARTIQTGKRMKIDRRALMSVARKAGLQVAKR